MSETSFWSRLAGRERARQQTVQEKFAALVKARCDGKELTVDAVEKVLQECGKKAEDLRAAEERLNRRRTARQALDAGKTALLECDKLTAALAAARAALEGAVTAAN